MQQAQASCARDWNVDGLEKRQPPQRIKKTVYKTNNKRKLYIKCAAVVFGYALILVFLCMKSAALGYQIEQLQQEVLSMENANLRLEYQIAEQSSLARVEQVAVAELGMYKPDAKVSMAMSIQNEPMELVGTVPTAVVEPSLSQKWWDGMYSGISRLALKNN